VWDAFADLLELNGNVLALGLNAEQLGELPHGDGDNGRRGEAADDRVRDEID
jgi:hypothetical protein